MMNVRGKNLKHLKMEAIVTITMKTRTMAFNIRGVDDDGDGDEGGA